MKKKFLISKYIEAKIAEREEEPREFMEVGE